MVKLNETTMGNKKHFYSPDVFTGVPVQVIVQSPNRDNNFQQTRTRLFVTVTGNIAIKPQTHFIKDIPVTDTILATHHTSERIYNLIKRTFPKAKLQTTNLIKQTTTFIGVRFYGKTSDLCREQNLGKGSSLMISGHLQVSIKTDLARKRQNEAKLNLMCGGETGIFKTIWNSHSEWK